MGCLWAMLWAASIANGLAAAVLLLGGERLWSSSWGLAGLFTHGFGLLITAAAIRWSLSEQNKSASTLLGASAAGVVCFFLGFRWLVAWNYTFVNRHYLRHAMKNNSLALLVYASDNNGVLPSASVWMTASGGFYKAAARNLEPMWANPEGGSIAFLSRLGGAKLAAIEDPSQHVMLFDSTLAEKNAHSDLSTLPKLRYAESEGRRGWGPVFCFADAEGGVNLAAQAAYSLDGRPKPGAEMLLERITPPALEAGP